MTYNPTPLDELPEYQDSREHTPMNQYERLGVEAATFNVQVSRKYYFGLLDRLMLGWWTEDYQTFHYGEGFIMMAWLDQHPHSM